MIGHDWRLFRLEEHHLIVHCILTCDDSQGKSNSPSHCIDARWRFARTTSDLSTRMSPSVCTTSASFFFTRCLLVMLRHFHHSSEQGYEAFKSSSHRRSGRVNSPKTLLLCYRKRASRPIKNLEKEPFAEMTSVGR